MIPPHINHPLVLSAARHGDELHNRLNGLVAGKRKEHHARPHLHEFAQRHGLAHALRHVTHGNRRDPVTITNPPLVRARNGVDNFMISLLSPSCTPSLSTPYCCNSFDKPNNDLKGMLLNCRSEYSTVCLTPNSSRKSENNVVPDLCDMAVAVREPIQSCSAELRPPSLRCYATSPCRCDR